jgi:hypothetical protein
MQGLIAAGIPGLAELASPPWRYETLDTSHWPMFSAPAELAAKLDRIASDSR